MEKFNPELQQNLFYTVYFLLAHNALAILYFLCLVASTAWSLYKPSRKATLLMIGFASLLFAFEYSKHIADALKEQTVNSLITETPRYRLAHLISVTISKLIPILLNLTGVISLLAAGFIHLKERDFSLRSK